MGHTTTTNIFDYLLRHSLTCLIVVLLVLSLTGETDTRIQEKLETKVWDPDNQLKDPQIDQFLVVAR